MLKQSIESCIVQFSILAKIAIAEVWCPRLHMGCILQFGRAHLKTDCHRQQQKNLRKDKSQASEHAGHAREDTGDGSQNDGNNNNHYSANDRVGDDLVRRGLHDRGEPEIEKINSV